jgi:hypothetical protein
MCESKKHKIMVFCSSVGGQISDEPTASIFNRQYEGSNMGIVPP